MSRRPPGYLRTVQYAKRPESSLAVNGLPAKTLRQITHAAHEGRCDPPDGMALALDNLKRFLGRPGTVLVLDGLSSMCPCCEPREALDVLHRIIIALPPRSRPPVTALVKPLSERYRARTLPDPHAQPDQPWWWRRITDI